MKGHWVLNHLISDLNCFCLTVVSNAEIQKKSPEFYQLFAAFQIRSNLLNKISSRFKYQLPRTVKYQFHKQHKFFEASTESYSPGRRAW